MNIRISILLIAFVFVQTSLLADRPGNPAKVDEDYKAYMDDYFLKIGNDIEEVRIKQEISGKRIAKLQAQIGDSVAGSHNDKGHYPWEIWLTIIVLGLLAIFKLNRKTSSTPSMTSMQPATDSGQPEKAKQADVITIWKRRDDNRFIKEYIQFYLSSAETDFAVFITAPWGNGKTYFAKELLESIKKDNPENPQGVYVSLNGMSTSSEIDRALFTAMHPILGSKCSRLAGHLLNGILQTGIHLALPLTKDNSKSLELELPKILFDNVNIDGKKI